MVTRIQKYYLKKALKQRFWAWKHIETDFDCALTSPLEKCYWHVYFGRLQPMRCEYRRKSTSKREGNYTAHFLFRIYSLILYSTLLHLPPSILWLDLIHNSTRTHPQLGKISTNVSYISFTTRLDLINISARIFRIHKILKWIHRC